MVFSSDGSHSQAVTAAQFGKCLTWYKDDRILRHCGTLHQPLAVTEIPERPGMIALAESHQVIDPSSES